MTDQNLYQLIGISETASLQEIETAAVKKYNEARNLVNHHTPEIANNASQELNKIEKARTILLDPIKKNEYDRTLGMDGGIGGLADPSQILGKFSNLGEPTLPFGMNRQQIPQSQLQKQPGVDQLVALNAWICSKCETPNAKGTKFCKKCGNTVGMNCPNCGKLIEASGERCTECGVSLKHVLKQSEMELEANAGRIQEQMRVQPILSEMQKQSNSALSLSSSWWWILAGYGLITWIIGYKKAVNVLNMQEIDSPLAQTYKNNAEIARSRAKTNLIIFACLTALYFVIILISAAINS